MNPKENIIISPQVHKRRYARYEAYQVISNLTICASESILGEKERVCREYVFSEQTKGVSRYVCIVVFCKPPPKIRRIYA